MVYENVQPVATVTGLYRGKFSGLEPLTAGTPLTRDEVRRNPIFYELDLHPEQDDENLIIDVIYDNMSPMRLQDLYGERTSRKGAGSGRTGSTSRRIWTCGMWTSDGCSPGPLAFTLSRSARAGASLPKMGRVRDFSPANGGYTSQVFEIRIAEDRDV